MNDPSSDLIFIEFILFGPPNAKDQPDHDIKYLRVGVVANTLCHGLGCIQLLGCNDGIHGRCIILDWNQDASVGLWGASAHILFPNNLHFKFWFSASARILWSFYLNPRTYDYISRISALGPFEILNFNPEQFVSPTLKISGTARRRLRCIYLLGCNDDFHSGRIILIWNHDASSWF